MARAARSFHCSNFNLSRLFAWFFSAPPTFQKTGTAAKGLGRAASSEARLHGKRGARMEPWAVQQLQSVWQKLQQVHQRSLGSDSGSWLLALGACRLLFDQVEPWRSICSRSKLLSSMSESSGSLGFFSSSRPCSFQWQAACRSFPSSHQAAGLQSATT